MSVKISQTTLVVLFLLFLPVFFTQQALAFSGSGSGTSGNPFQITTCSQLHEIANNLSANYLLMNDLNCNGFSFAPIGDTTSNFFVGTLDGGGHKITNLTINSDENGVGIFEEVGSGGLITNIGYESGSVTSHEDSSKLGSFAGFINGGSITKSYSKASLDGTDVGFISPVAGGLFGVGGSVTVSDSYYSGNIVSGTTNPNFTGGIAGSMAGGSITNSYSTGSITNGSGVGGITGTLNSAATITNSFTTMTFINASTVGAVVGNKSIGTITNTYWNDTSGGFFTCYFGGNTGCNRITNSIPYFYTVTNPPMNSWDFVNTWSTINNGTNYPLLYWQSPNPAPTPTPTATPAPPVASISSSSPSAPTCSSSAPTNAPKLFQISANKNAATLYFIPVSGQNSGYYISYGVNSDASGFSASFNYSNTSGVVPYTINALFPGTWYFKVRGQNGCMPGGWSNIVSVKIGSGSTATKVLGAATVVNLNTGKCTIYTVQSGDTLWGIASSHLGNGAQFGNIMQKNNLSSSLIHTGQVLKVGC